VESEVNCEKLYKKFEQERLNIVGYT
jgi:hypothetical protein